MKKIVALLLCLVLVLSAFSGCGTDPNAIIIGSTTDVNGDFFDGWTNSAQNAGIKQLIHGNETVAFTKKEVFEWNNTVVKSHSEKENEDGSKTFTIEVYDDMLFCDGTPITAADYILPIVLQSTKEYQDLEEVSVAGYDVYKGYYDYLYKTNEAFSGIRLLDKYKFSITVAKTTIDPQDDTKTVVLNLPYHYDITYAAVNPMPSAVIIPGLEVKDDGNGAYIKGLTNELLQKTMLDTKTGYRFNPKVTAGAYKLVSYNKGSKQAVLELNDKFKGMYDGTKPSIPKLIFKLTTAATEVEELGKGAVDLIPGVTGGDEVSKAKDFEDKGVLSANEYGRNGFGYIAFACNFGPSQYAEVRQAVTYLMDRNEFAKQYTEGYGTSLSGYYGLGQQEYILNKEWVDKTLNAYTFSVDKAIEVLVKGGWIYDETGADFSSGIRHKKLDDGTFMPLILKWNSSTGNPVSTQIAATLTPELCASAGLKIERTETDFATLLDNFGQLKSQEYHMFNLALGFVPINSFWYDFDPKLGGIYNSVFIDDKEIYEISLKMKNIPFDDNDAWTENWKKLQVRYNYLMPYIPLYSNIYFDYYGKKLTDYETTTQWSWYYEIPFAKLAEVK